MKTAIPVILLFVAAMASCNAQVNSNRHINNGQTVLRKVHADTSNTWSSYHNVRQLSSQLRLSPAEAGFDSLQIRIWFDYSLARRKHSIVIERKRNEWAGRLYEMNVSYVDTLNYNLLQRYETKAIEPMSGWQGFVSDLYRLKISELSGANGGGTDGTIYCVEILTPGKYTYYDFWEPGYTKDSNLQSKNMVEIVELLEKEFNFSRLKSK